jgi:hypothetical protein
MDFIFQLLIFKDFIRIILLHIIQLSELMFN